MNDYSEAEKQAARKQLSYPLERHIEWMKEAGLTQEQAENSAKRLLAKFREVASACRPESEIDVTHLLKTRAGGAVSDTQMVRVTVVWPDRETTEWFLVYPVWGSHIQDEHGDLWKVTKVRQVPAPKAGYAITVAKHVPRSMEERALIQALKDGDEKAVEALSERLGLREDLP